MSTPEERADDLAKADLEREKQSIAEGLDYSEREIRVAVRNMANSVTGLRVALGMVTSNLRAIRGSLESIRTIAVIIAVIMFVRLCIAIWR